jgi:iron(III) transport system ATP-binding protein
MKITLENLSLQYSGNTVVKELDLEIADGESLVLLGQSGCGKTSTMRCIAGLEQPSGGRITIGDTVVHDSERQVSVAPYKRNVGMVFQSYAVWPHRTVAENVGFP